MSLRVITFVNGRWRQNCYIVANGDGEALIIDPGREAAKIVELSEQNRLRVHAIVNTHAHHDHIGAVAGLKDRYRDPFYLHGADENLLRHANLYRMFFENGEAVSVPSITHDISALADVFEVGPLQVSWIGTPGHTAGSVCLSIENLLFSGDTLMRTTVGRTDLPGGNRDQIVSSLRALMALPNETVVFGGHGPQTTIGTEFAIGSPVRSWLG